MLLKDMLIDKLEEGGDIEAIFMKRSVEEEKNLTIINDTKEGAC